MEGFRLFFECRYEVHGINEGGNRWRLFFKLFCFLDTKSIPKDSLEAGFMFEQAYDDVIQGRFPSTTQTLVRLAALRVQYENGDYRAGASIPSIELVYPVKKKSKDEDMNTMERGFTLKGTLRGLGRNTLKKLRQGQSGGDESSSNKSANDDPELQAVKVAVSDQWKKLQGMPQEVAQQQYMDVMKSWDGYGSTLFDVEYKQDSRYPRELWLGISARNVSLYKRGEGQPLASFVYEE
jgi:myosin X